jgi:hypothetical protein
MTIHKEKRGENINYFKADEMSIKMGIFSFTGLAMKAGMVGSWAS